MLCLGVVRARDLTQLRLPAIAAGHPTSSSFMLVLADVSLPWPSAMRLGHIELVVHCDTLSSQQVEQACVAYTNRYLTRRQYYTAAWTGPSFHSQLGTEQT